MIPVPLMQPDLKLEIKVNKSQEQKDA